MKEIHPKEKYNSLIKLRISQVPMFSDLPEEEYNLIYNKMLIRKYNNEEFLTHEGERNDLLLVILSGSVEIVRHSIDGNKTVFRILHPSAILGVNQLAGRTHSADIIASNTVLTAEIPVSVIKNLYQRIPELGFKAICILSNLVDQLSTELTEIRNLPLKERVFNALKRNMDSTAVLKMSHEELAKVVGATRSNVSRSLKLLEKEGLLRLERKTIIIQKERS